MTRTATGDVRVLPSANQCLAYATNRHTPLVAVSTPYAISSYHIYLIDITVRQHVNTS